jgi:hypothetical protein
MLNNKIFFSVVFLLMANTGWAQPYPGGSNYGWYNVVACDREPYGVIPNYHLVQSTIDGQLTAMYNNGQRRLRIPIYFTHGAGSGTVMDATGGNIAPQYQTNLANLLAKIGQIGFHEILISFHPIGPSAVEGNTTNWATWNETLFQEHWNLIYNLRPIIVGAGVPYRIDLYNEGVPHPSSSNSVVTLTYMQKLWNYYVYSFGKNDTVGFSIIGDYDRARNSGNIFRNSPFGNHGRPYVYDVHLYTDAANKFHQTRLGLQYWYGQNVPGWIIGEAYYNNALEAQQISSAMTQYGQTVHYLTQWPWDVSNPSCGGINVAPPISFSNYQSYGF